MRAGHGKDSNPFLGEFDSCHPCMKTYRELLEGEVILQTDVYKTDDGTYKLFPKGLPSVVGETYKRNGRYVRIKRKIESRRNKIIAAF